jgi:hypothetical protein
MPAPDSILRLVERFDANRRAINALVYDLFGLTDAEIRIVEGE